MGKILAAALIAVIAVDKIKFDNELYMPGEKVDGLTPEQAQGLVDNGHARHVKDEAAAPEASGGAGDGDSDGDAAAAAAAAATAATRAPAAKTPATKTPATKTVAKK